MTDAPAERTRASPEPVRGTRGRARVVPWWFIAPAAVIYCFVTVVPDVQAMAYSLTDWNGLANHFSFIGLTNYVSAFENPNFVKGLVNTVALTIMITLAQLVIGLLLALALSTRLKSKTVLRTLFFTPVVLTSVAVGYIWKFLYAPTGAINQILDAIGLHALAHDWLGDPSVNLWSIAVMCVWQSAGVTMVIFIAGLEGIDSETLEAAHLDGANGWQRFWYVIRPLLAPAVLINSLLCVIGGLKIFDQIFITTQGGPARSTATLATMSYTDGFVAGDYSYGITLSIILAVLVGAVSIVQFRMTRTKENR
ncbi:sugar ABC transporter permease [Leifsonia sp. ZF2019]|uniref:carbohydrate ABC transporter permease n=1 Tax=Leifsonia sp. ZF2019 TaxID=2781978 RepID=UPI001CBAD712|nr:sugar ABC transporter permease [Leifsonia sp. ZF2019]UAJ79512.1 sugar ABC transporter permease [Leifsonia sp. ZF2019]